MTLCFLMYPWEEVHPENDTPLARATEIAQDYCDERVGVNFPEVVASASRQLRKWIPLQLAEFQESL